VYDNCTELTSEQFALCLATTRAHQETSVALNKLSRPRPNTDMNDNVTLCTVAFIRHTTSATSAIKLSRAR